MSILGIVRTAALFFAIAGMSAWADDYASVTFSLTNGTEATIDQFYASPPSADDWEEDILGTDVLEPGDSIDITINDSRPDCDYDFKAIFEDGSELVHEAVTVCDGEEYVYQ